MNTFQIRYENEESSANGQVFTVREIEGFDNHYFISDNKSHIGGGRLAKKYCIKLPENKNMHV